MESALLVHGAGGGSWEWNCWARVFQAHAVVPSSIQLQPSAAGLESTTVAEYAAQVGAALRTMRRPRALVGASLGGLVSTLCAEDADALVLVNPFPIAPWHLSLPAREWTDRVPWQRNARLASTRAAMQDSDEASVLYAFRRWRDESGLALRQGKAGIPVAKPPCPVLFVLSAQDADVPPESGAAWARAWRAECLQTFASSHLGPLQGRQGSVIAAQAVAWLNRIITPC